MNLYMLYRISMYAMLILATFVLSIDAGEFNQFALMYPLGVALAAAGALATVDRDPSLGLPRDLANFLAMGSFVLAALEYWATDNEQSKVLAMGHWLVYLQLVKMFLPKTNEDDWFLFMLALVQVLVGAYLSQSDLVGTLLVTWAILAMWTMGLFHLHRESQKSLKNPLGRISPAPDPKRPYPGLINPGFVLSSFLVALSTLLLGGCIFLVMPRWGGAKNTQGAPTGTRHLTGFSDQVRLGQMGEILENDNLVMTIELLDARDRAIQPVNEPYWRGVTLVRYSNGRWVREETNESTVIAHTEFPNLSDDMRIRQHVKLEASASDVVFAMPPVWGVRGRRSLDMVFNTRDGSLLLNEQRRSDAGEPPLPRGSFEYDVFTSTNRNDPQPLERFPTRSRLQELKEVPFELRDTLREFADKVLKDAPGTSAEETARRLESHLRDTGGFYYSLRMQPPAAKQDPVIDFLYNRKEGHCEYFASALALLLRSRGIPARLVNGFKGGDWNELVRVTNVREKHAHSWVEALVGKTANGLPRWILLDATPGVEREAVAARVGGVTPQFRTLSDALRHIWVFYVSGFDQERQDRLIYAPVRQFFRLLGQGFLIVNAVLSRYFGDFFRFNQIGDVFSVKGFLVSVTLMVVTLAFVLVARRVARWLLRRFRAREARQEKRDAEVQFYLRFQKVLAALGMERGHSETPREFARRATGFLSSYPNFDISLLDLPDRAVDAFYGIRYGETEPGSDTLRWLDDRLLAFETALAPAMPRRGRP